MFQVQLQTSHSTISPYSGTLAAFKAINRQGWVSVYPFITEILVENYFILKLYIYVFHILFLILFQTCGFFRGLGFPLVSYGLVNSVFFGVYGNTLRLISEGRENPSHGHVAMAGTYNFLSSYMYNFIL